MSCLNDCSQVENLGFAFWGFHLVSLSWLRISSIKPACLYVQDFYELTNNFYCLLLIMTLLNSRWLSSLMFKCFFYLISVYKFTQSYCLIVRSNLSVGRLYTALDGTKCNSFYSFSISSLAKWPSSLDDVILDWSYYN